MTRASVAPIHTLTARRFCSLYGDAVPLLNGGERGALILVVSC